LPLRAAALWISPDRLVAGTIESWRSSDLTLAGTTLPSVLVEARWRAIATFGGRATIVQ
jgi:hypothetical protein